MMLRCVGVFLVIGMCEAIDGGSSIILVSPVFPVCCSIPRLMSIESVLQRSRRELLDLSAHNRLIHVPLDGKRQTFLRVRGIAPDAVFERLVRQRRALALLPEAEPPEATMIETTDPAEEPGTVESIGITATGDVPEDSGPVESLRVRMKDEALSKRLLRMFYDARTAEEEQGVSVLYLAVGFLHWTEATGSKSERSSPLILIPVDLVRDDAKSNFRLTFRDEDLVSNLSLRERLNNDFGIRLPTLPDDLADEGELVDYFRDVERVAEGYDHWRVDPCQAALGFFSFNKFLMFDDLRPEKWPDDRPLTGSRLIRGVLGEGFGGDADGSAGGGLVPAFCDADEPLDRLLNPADTVHIADADSSQAVAIEEIARGRDLVVQGPPGTGKSQTITNAIAAAVHAGKTVLFVAEKSAALDVVRRRLDDAGLGSMTLELHSHKTKKSEVLADLQATLSAGRPRGGPTVNRDSMRDDATTLRRHDQVLHRPIGKSDMTAFMAMGEHLRLKAAGHPLPDYSVAAAADWSTSDRRRAVTAAEELAIALRASGVPSHNPWHSASCDPPTPADLQRQIEAVRPVPPTLRRIGDASASLAERLGRPRPSTLREIAELALIAAAVGKLPPKVCPTIFADSRWSDDSKVVRDAIGEARKFTDGLQNLSGRVIDDARQLDLRSTRMALAAHGRSWLRVFNRDHRRALATLRGLCVGPIPASVEDRLALVETLIRVGKAEQSLQSVSSVLMEMLGPLWRQHDTDFDLIDELFEWIDRVESSPQDLSAVVNAAAKLKRVDEVQEALKIVRGSFRATDRRIAEALKVWKIDPKAAFGVATHHDAPIDELTDRITKWLDNPERLGPYLRTVDRLEQLRSLGLGRVCDEIASGVLHVDQVVDRVRWVAVEALINRVWKDAGLSDFDGQSFQRTRKSFADADRKTILRNRFDVAVKHHDRLPPVDSGGGQMGVLRHEMNKKRRHKPIRKLIAEAGGAIQRIKPVFMMSPLSVARYLQPGAVEFDLLVIDEASQVQPVDALGAMARCGQIVVVGDKKQLPPTNFFANLGGDPSDDDDDPSDPATADLESVLGLCESRGLPSRMLRWHYRSRHESLIAVSNRQFYDDRLFIVPSPLVDGEVGDEIGLSMQFIEDGWYDRGRSRVNRPEAAAVAAAVMRHASQTPGRSLGVATFSAAQRDAILDELELRRREDDSAEDFFAPGGPMPFFVKSLENIQGDERDVIFISIGYAKDRDGYFAQNFGPLNRDGGQRRLNVLITRASSACRVFTSIRADDIDLARSDAEGVVALKMFLHYAQHGRLEAHRSHGDVDSPFESEVARALRARGLIVDHQIGEAGFFIDMAIRDPERPGRYLLGIECDGAQYHSARWVRDRDRLRQEVLESRGWRIHRIWSTDWFARPEEGLRDVLHALGEAQRELEISDSSAAGRPVPPRTIVQAKANVSNDGETQWDRVEVTRPGSENRIEYETASPEWLTQDLRLPEADDSVLLNLMTDIVRVESPIHVDELIRRTVDQFNGNRLGKTARERLRGLVRSALDRNRFKQRGDFLYRHNQIEFPVRGRTDAAAPGVRKPDRIAPEEFESAIIDSVRRAVVADAEGIQREVSRQFGINRTTAFSDTCDGVIKRLVTDGRLDQRGTNLQVSVDPS